MSTKDFTRQVLRELTGIAEMERRDTQVADAVREQLLDRLRVRRAKVASEHWGSQHSLDLVLAGFDIAIAEIGGEPDE